MAADIVTDGDTSHAACPHDHSFAGGVARTSHLEVPLGKSQSAISDHTRMLTQTGLTARRSAGQVDLVAHRVRPASPPSGRCPAARRSGGGEQAAVLARAAPAQERAVAAGCGRAAS